MTLPKKLRNLRKIYVEGQDFLWKPATIVYPLESQLTKLVIDSGFKDPWLHIHEPGFKNHNDPSIITPGFVADAIKFALKRGWKPYEHRGEFKITYADGKFSSNEEK